MHPAEILANTMRRIYDAGLTSVSGGNISYLDDEGTLWITPSGTDKAALSADQIVCVRPDGSMEGKFKPSVELPFHQLVYKLRPDVRMVVHAHPPLASAFAIARKPVDVSCLPDAQALCNSMGMAGYDLPGSASLGEKVAYAFADGHDSVLLESHGLAVVGTSAEDAFGRLERLEALAHTLLMAKRLGGAPVAPIALPKAQYDPVLPAVPCNEIHETLAVLTRRAHRKGLIQMLSGTFSQRCGKGFVILKQNADRACVSAEDMVYVEGAQCETGKTPDASAALHAQIYAAHPEIHSVCTACPPSASAYLLTDKPFPPVMLSESHIVLRAVAAADSVDEAVEKLTLNQPIVLLRGGCVITTAAKPFTAFDRLEVLDMTALSSALAPGDAFLLTDEEKHDIEQKFW